MRICLWCKTEFEPVTWQGRVSQKYCNTFCQNEASRKRWRDKTRLKVRLEWCPDLVKPCRQCSKTFTPRNTRHLSCSVICKQRYLAKVKVKVAGPKILSRDHHLTS